MTSSAGDPSTELAKIRRATAGDQDVLAELLDAHRPRLRRMVALRIDRRLQGRIDPSDVIQEAYVDAAAGLARYAERAEMSFFVWLRWLATMKLNALHRKHLGCQARDAAREVSIDRGITPRASSDVLAARLIGRFTSACEAAIRRERKLQLREALESMDELDREILVLRHFEDLTNAEVAEALGLQESAASKRYIRALRKIKSVLRAKQAGGEDSLP